MMNYIASTQPTTDINLNGDHNNRNSRRAVGGTLSSFGETLLKCPEY